MRSWRLWGAPIPHADDPDRAVAAAIGMQRALVALNEKWKEEGKPEIGVGIGINYGDTFAGNIGSHLRLEYTVIGDAVNVASRLCSKCLEGRNPDQRSAVPGAEGQAGRGTARTPRA